MDFSIVFHDGTWVGTRPIFNWVGRGCSRLGWERIPWKVGWEGVSPGTVAGLARRAVGYHNKAALEKAAL